MAIEGLAGKPAARQGAFDEAGPGSMSATNQHVAHGSRHWFAGFVPHVQATRGVHPADAQRLRPAAGKDDESIPNECERGEDVALKSYRKALEKDLPVDVRSVVEGQMQGVQRNQDQVKALRDAERARSRSIHVAKTPASGPAFFINAGPVMRAAASSTNGFRRSDERSVLIELFG